MLARYPSEMPNQQAVAVAMSGIEQMVALAEQDNLEVVFCLIPPIEGLDSRVIALNTQITSYAQAAQLQAGGLLHAHGRASELRPRRGASHRSGVFCNAAGAD